MPESNEVLSGIVSYISLYSLRILGALVILVVGRWVAMGLRGLVIRSISRRDVDETVVAFVRNLTYIALMTFVILAALKVLGIQTASFVVVVGAAGLAIGLALQGSLANFAAGFLMLIFRPFKVGDYIEGAGTSGVVEAIEVFTTRLRTPDNKSVIIPNAKLTGDNIINFSANDTRRVDLVIGIGYADDIDKARQVVRDVIAQDARILEDPEPTVAVSELADSSVNFVVRVWTETSEYWNVYFATTESIKKAFDAEGVSIPFPQRDVHLLQAP